MLITLELANTIVKRAMSIIHYNVNVIDHRGVIIASGEPQRIGERHEVADEVIKNRQRMTIENAQQAARYKNVQPGINHPIIVDDQVVMVIGISGNRPLCRTGYSGSGAADQAVFRYPRDELAISYQGSLA